MYIFLFATSVRGAESSSKSSDYPSTIRDFNTMIDVKKGDLHEPTKLMTCQVSARDKTQFYSLKIPLPSSLFYPPRYTKWNDVEGSKLADQMHGEEFPRNALGRCDTADSKLGVYLDFINLRGDGKLSDENIKRDFLSLPFWNSSKVEPMQELTEHKADISKRNVHLTPLGCLTSPKFTLCRFNLLPVKTGPFSSTLAVILQQKAVGSAIGIIADSKDRSFDTSLDSFVFALSQRVQLDTRPATK